MHDIYILGNGAMGYLWASYFNNTRPIHIITRSKVEARFRITKRPDNSQINAQLTTPLEIKRQQNKIEHLIICTKAFDAQSALADLKHLLADTCQIVLIQNGMGSQQAIAQAYPNLAIYACSSTEGVYKESERVLMHAGHGENHIGPLTQQANQSRLEHWMPKSAFQWHSDIEPVLWRKLIINCAINPLTVVYQCRNGELLKDPKAHDHMAKICGELDQLSKYLNLGLHPTLSLAEKVCVSTAHNFSSMYQDSQHQRLTEIDYITGYVIKQFSAAAIECPENKALVSLIIS